MLALGFFRVLSASLIKALILSVTFYVTPFTEVLGVITLFGKLMLAPEVVEQYLFNAFSAAEVLGHSKLIVHLPVPHSVMS